MASDNATSIAEALFGKKQDEVWQDREIKVRAAMHTCTPSVASAAELFSSNIRPCVSCLVDYTIVTQQFLATATTV
jgi:hypothetical protein